MSAYYNEIDPFAAEWLRELIKAGMIAPGEVDERSIEDVLPADIRGFSQHHFFAGIGVWSYALRQAGWSDDRPVWTGSCPCQPFSAAGKGAGFADERHLWPAFFHLIEQCRPAIVFGEQVASKAVEPWVDLVQADLEAVGYSFGCVPFPAASVGAPHIRDRAFWLGYSSEIRRQQLTHGHGWNETRVEQDGRESIKPSETSSNACGLANTEGAGWGVLNPKDVGAADAQVYPPANPGHRKFDGEQRLASSSSCPTNGFWRDADWLFCRDGKWRPVIASFIALADGFADRMGLSCAGCEHQKEEVGHAKATACSTKNMPIMREYHGEKTVQREIGGQVNIPKEKILQSCMYGKGASEGCLHKQESQPNEINQKNEGGLRELQGDLETACSSCGRQPFKQFPVKFNDIVRFLSSETPLTELHGGREVADKLQVLREKINQERSLLHPHYTVEEVWASISEEKKDRLKLGFDVREWRKVVFHPLSRGEHNRVGRLRGYGNAIVAQQAQAFIKAFMEITK